MILSELVNLIQSDARYLSAFQDGDNGELLRLLNEDDDLATPVWVSVDAMDFLDAVAAETLTAAQEARIQTYVASGARVPTDRANVRQWIVDQNWSAPTMANLRAIAEKPAKYCQPALEVGEERVSLRDVRRAVKQIPGYVGSMEYRDSVTASKASRKAVEEARRTRITAEVLAEGPAGIRSEVAKQFRDAAKRLQAEVLLRVREERAVEAMGG